MVTKLKKTTVQRQNASEIAGTNSTPPLATTRLLAIKIGCINNTENENISVLIFFNLIDTNLYQRRLRISS